ncbi:MAG TPA: tetratricopeptide repeat protein [bacterium]|nr:tetratricopeptide repeat protein [bacterium]
MERDISIVHIAPPQITDGGDFVYRLSQPDAALGRMPGVVTASVTNLISGRHELLMRADVLVVQLLGEPDLVPVIADRKKAGRPTVFEVSDNFLDFQPSNPAAAFYEDPENRACILQLISLCDAVQTTVPPLAEMFSKYNERIVVFENRMESTGDPGRPEGPLVAGWGGSVGHYEDMKEAAPYIIEWLKRRPEARFSLMGDRAFSELFSGAPDGSFMFIPTGSLADYYEFVQTLHIGIAPARDDAFNLCRSDVKFMEYASRGTVPVCSDIPTYSRTLRDGETGFLFGNLEEMIAVLDKLADDPALRGRVGRQALEYIRTERGEDAAAVKRLEFYRSLFRDDSQPGGLTVVGLEKNRSLRKTPGSRHFLHVPTESETMMYNAMIYQFGHGDRENAIRSYAAAIATESGYFLAHNYFARMLESHDVEAAERNFRRALEIWPGSCDARVRLGRLLGSKNDMDEAVKLLMETIEQYPEYAQAYHVTGELSLINGALEEAAQLMERAVEVNPYYIPSMLKMGVIALDGGKLGRAERMFRKVIGLHLRNAQARYGLGITLRSQGDEARAVEQMLEAIRLLPGCESFVKGYLDHALAKYKSGDKAQAVELLKNGADAAPGNAELLFWTARIIEREIGADEASGFWNLLAVADTTGRYERYYTKKQ